MREKIEAYIFYFDLIGVVDGYAADPRIFDRIVEFQRNVRAIPTGFGERFTSILTAYDNVIARVNAEEMVVDYAIMDFGSDVMRLAIEAGFNSYFGAITRGQIAIDLFDQTLVTGGDATDIRSQHLSFLGDPHIRGAFAEKWSGALSKAKRLPIGWDACVWVSEEVVESITNSPIGDLAGVLDADGSKARVLSDTLDLKKMKVRHKPWPFPQSRFRAIVPR